MLAKNRSHSLALCIESINIQSQVLQQSFFHVPPTKYFKYEVSLLRTTTYFLFHKKILLLRNYYYYYVLLLCFFLFLLMETTLAMERKIFYYEFSRPRHAVYITISLFIGQIDLLFVVNAIAMLQIVSERWIPIVEFDVV